MILLSLFVISSFNVTKAATGSKYLAIKLLRASGFGYQALDKNVWKIVEATDLSGDSMIMIAQSTVYLVDLDLDQITLKWNT